MKGVSLVYTVYDIAGRSLKKMVFDLPVGGRVTADQHGNASVVALKDISLDIEEGDRIAILGHNGAGKSTLLRVMSGVYVPHHGHVDIDGKISTLFNINLGIDSSATGYDNIIMRGLVLGMSRSEIEEQIDDICEFSGLGSFLHMPVRTYSSGMQMRLAFSVSTSLQPEILLMDEWIGTGDHDFIEKADKRLENFIECSSILVFATHNTSHASRLCNKTILMKQGKIIDFDKTSNILENYGYI